MEDTKMFPTPGEAVNKNTSNYLCAYDLTRPCNTECAARTTEVLRDTRYFFDSCTKQYDGRSDVFPILWPYYNRGKFFIGYHMTEASLPPEEDRR